MSAHALPPERHHWYNLQWQDLLLVMLCIVASVSAAFLSGVHFPEMNNIWHLPVVLDFANSTEGPHDAYHKTFWHFISIYWLLVKAIVNDKNVQSIFITLQLTGNALLSLTFYFWMRTLVGRRWAAGIATAGFCFCYGLWGPTRLGYSEMFVTYATHTQVAVVACLLGLLFLIQDRYIWAAVMIGMAAEVNLFMAAWAALAAGGYLIFEERRLITRTQIGFAVVVLALTTPVLMWALRGSTISGPGIPVGFFRSHFAGHIYAFEYPQATVQTFSLGILAGAATISNAAEDIGIRRLGVVMLCCVAALAAGVAMPYFTNAPLLLSLYPLRFVSITDLLAAICAGVLVVRGLDALGNDSGRGALLAAAGFLLKSPLVSMLGFALSVPHSKPRLRLLSAALLVVGIIGVLLRPSAIFESPTKSGLSFILVSTMLVLARCLYSGGKSLESDKLLGVGVGALGAIAAVPPSTHTSVAVAAVLSVPAAVLLTVPGTFDLWRRLASAAAVGAVAVVLFSVGNHPIRLLSLAIGSAIAFGSVLAPRVRLPWLAGSARGPALASPIFLLIGFGIAKGAATHFSVTRTPEEQEYIAAQIWARANTAPDTVFYAPKDKGFSLYSRRPIWWEPSQTPAVMWDPSYYQLWRCRSRAAEAANSLERVIELGVNANIEFLVLPAEEKATSSGSFEPIYHTSHYIILKRVAGKVSHPLCPEE